MGKQFQITVSTIDGQLLADDQTRWFDCDLVKPLGNEIIRQYDANECIVARKVYLFYYGGHVFGTRQVSDMGEFLNYRNSKCVDQECCFLLFNGCNVTINGKRITING